MTSIPPPLRIVHLEDDLNDALLIRSALEQDGLACDIHHVSKRADFLAALESGAFGLILSDYALPGFDGLAALDLARRTAPETPFILVSGTLGEEAAIESLRGGATDYVLKHRLTRLAPAVRRAIEEASERKTRREAEQALEREQQYLRAVLDSLDSGVMACGPDGVLMFFNRATRELHGLPLEPLPPERWADHYQLFHADGTTPLDPEAVPLYRAFRGEQLRHVEVTIRHASGLKRTLVCSGQPIVDGRGNKLGAVVAMEDVSERRQLELQFRQAQKMEAMGSLAAGVAHDFNNLVTVITGYSQLARKRLHSPTSVGQDLDQITKAGERAANLTRQLLAFSRQQVMETRVLDLNAVVGEVEKMLRRLIRANIELTFAPAPDVGQVRADAGQIEQVLMNLVVNARDAMPEGGSIRIETASVVVRAGEGAMPPGSYVQLSVADCGCGMDRETAARIFEPFFTTKEVGQGTGLGLSTVHGIVSQSGGHITVESDLGHGTTFRIYLPRITATVEPARPVRLQPTGGGSETVLVVDDDAAVLGLVREILEVHGYTVLEANNGVSALALIQDRAQVIHALLTDVIMPNLGGRQLYERIEELRPNTPTLFMSGYPGDSIDKLGALLGPRVGFVQKPFEPGDLLTRLRSILDHRAEEAA